ncbi:phosphoribosyltransferase domain-containing protein [Pseudomonas sp. Marseille-Q5115]|uniref:phosphoribosyltransferase domain-containing protein n=1 Tax=Pseudomonas sp. Marseille-Q5115 TaxID=2866593 RepID=UPI001CE41A44|nr:phosphoribosyltransferase domain-containing protein [Pseudomonas sp. Marseille-Q5115]
MESSVTKFSSTKLRAVLRQGVLDVEVQSSVVPPRSLFGFAERHNPRRAFLFVSRVLGKHIPVAPSRFSETCEQLASRLPSDLPGPVLFIGLAETAVGLGAGVHRAYSRFRPDSMYLVTTRHFVAEDVFACFEEEHSHASTHLLHAPAAPALREMMLSARSLVLVDDEASTGKTLLNLYNALLASGLSRVERLVTSVLTDWSGGAITAAVGEHAAQVSLLRGAYRFTGDSCSVVPARPRSGLAPVARWPIDPANDWGRLGVRNVADTLGRDLQAVPGENILVIGTGEFVWKPFLLAERLERSGARVHFCSTTRSPIAAGHAIERVIAFPDNYGQGIDNFLYNVAPGQFERVLLCTETHRLALPVSLIDTLNAQVIVDGE